MSRWTEMRDGGGCGNHLHEATVLTARVQLVSRRVHNHRAPVRDLERRRRRVGFSATTAPVYRYRGGGISGRLTPSMITSGYGASTPARCPAAGVTLAISTNAAAPPLPESSASRASVVRAASKCSTRLPNPDARSANAGDGNQLERARCRTHRGARWRRPRAPLHWQARAHHSRARSSAEVRASKARRPRSTASTQPQQAPQAAEPGRAPADALLRARQSPGAPARRVRQPIAARRFRDPSRRRSPDRSHAKSEGAFQQFGRVSIQSAPHAVASARKTGTARASPTQGSTRRTVHAPRQAAPAEAGSSTASQPPVRRMQSPRTSAAAPRQQRPAVLRRAPKTGAPGRSWALGAVATPVP